jgi:hypothetical protein
MATLDDVGEADQWRCWLCDEPVEPDRSVNDARGPSIDSRTTAKKAKKKSKRSLPPRLAHRSCNTGKGNTDAVVPWPDELFVIDPVPLIAAAERLAIKGGREVFCRCPTEEDGAATATWLLDRLSRLEPDLAIDVEVSEGGGQYLVTVRAS